MPDEDSAAERTLRRVVNVGVISLARMHGAEPEARLRLRCECGARGCTRAVEATAAEHHDAGCRTVMVFPAHREAVRGRVTEATERFVKIDVAGAEGAAG